MPLQSFPMPTSGMTVDQLANVVAQTGRVLSYLTGNLDSANINSVYLDQSTVKSSDGSTVFDGSFLEMYDKQSTPKLRLGMGYNPATSVEAFVFEMFNIAGTKIASLDTSGDLVWGGPMSISGAVTFMAAPGSVIAFKDTSDSNLSALAISNLGSGLGFQILGTNGANLQIGCNSGTLNISGIVSFANLSFVSFAGSVDFTHASGVTSLYTVGATTGSGGTPSHTHSIPDLNVVNYVS